MCARERERERERERGGGGREGRVRGREVEESLQSTHIMSRRFTVQSAEGVTETILKEGPGLPWADTLIEGGSPLGS